MGKLAFVFSGQGAQYSGMGKQLQENIAAAREVFDAAERIRPGITGLCFEGNAEELKQTVNAQPSIYCVGLAAAKSLESHGVKPDMVAGFSLGELAALSFSGAISTEEEFELVCKRGQLMQQSGEKNPSAMIAVLKLDRRQVDQLCEQFANVYPVNYNCPGQLVVAGAKDEIDEFKSAVRDLGGKCMPLQVSGGFHSPFMREAAEGFEKALAEYEIGDPQIKLYSNYTAEPYDRDPKELLAKQIINPVRWQDTIENMVNDGADTFVEVGPGKTLSNLINKIAPDVTVFNVEDVESLNNTLRGLESC